MKKYQKNGPPIRTIALNIKGQTNTKVGCGCKKTKCMNFFCCCFSASSSCAEGCMCEGCNNTPGYREMALNVNFKKFCNCSRSNCVKKYCNCFKNGYSCSKVCGCTNCKNVDIMDNASFELQHRLDENQKEDIDILGLVIEQIREEQTNTKILEASFEELEKINDSGFDNSDASTFGN